MTGELLRLCYKFLDTCLNVLPIVITILGFQFLVIRRALPHLKKTLSGFLFVLLGITFFLEGLDLALFPLGSLMASQLTAAEILKVNPHLEGFTWITYFWVYIFAACIGFATALAEPALLAVAIKAEEMSGGAIRPWGLRIAVALGVGLGLALGAFRIVSGIDLYYFIVPGFGLVLLQTITAPKMIIGLAYDSGGITTSMVTVPMVTALGLGLAQAVPGRNPVIDGFGLIAFASLFPIIAVLAYAQVVHWLNKITFSSKQ